MSDVADHNNTPRVVLVTGAAQGIGEAIAAAFLKLGDTVVGTDIDADTLSRAETRFADLPGQFVSRVADAGDVAAIGATVSEVTQNVGPISVLVNNAGVTRRAHILDLTEDDWDRINRVNAKGVFFFMQQVARDMAERGAGGRIVNIASVAGYGYRGSSNAIYAGTKGAVIAMTKLAASQLGASDITVNAVCPGITDTAIYRGIIERDAERDGISFDEANARVVETVPLKRANSTDDVADMVIWLASAGARNVTGQAIVIDGGLML